MVKNVIKEIIIVLLLCIAIILLLGILLYEYVPMNKTLPNTVAYTTPNNVKKELKEENANGGLIQTYEINSSDLDDYKRIQNYKPGKADPFSSYEATTEENNNSGVSNGSTGGTITSGQTGTTTIPNNNTSQQTNNVSGSGTTSSGGYFYKDTGTK